MHVTKNNNIMKPCYTGVGSRKTPKNILEAFTRIAKRLENLGYTLRSGAAGGADQAFEKGVSNLQEIYIPWNGFAPAGKGYHVGACEASISLASSLHPAWERCSQGAQKLHARNTYQVLGKNLKTPSQFLICWTEGGKSGNSYIK